MVSKGPISSNFEWAERLKATIAQGAGTNSKRPECFVKGVYPVVLEKGEGAHVWDTAGKRYIDFICGLGSTVLGHAQTEVVSAAYERLLKGASLPLSSTTEIIAAEKIKELFPFIERVRFLKTGSEACSAAIKIARAATGRDLILTDGYHGWADDFVSITPPALGVPARQSIEKFSWDTWLTKNAAAVIIEPVITDYSDERIEELRVLREGCTNTGTLLIFDEIITGFRWPRLSVAKHYNIEPDLICFGKAIANGLPLSVVGGRKKIMESSEYFVSSTFAGETVSLAAAIKTMTLLQTKYNMSYLWEAAALFQKRFNDSMREIVRIDGYPTRGVFVGEDLPKALFFQEACKAGMLFGSSFFFGFQHLTIVDQVIHTCQDIAMRIRNGMVLLEGEIPQTPFSQKVRNS